MVDKLASEYAAAGKPVVFIEQNKQYTTWFDMYRIKRFGAATVGASYPGIMLDSGNKATYGAKTDYYTTYKNLVEAELARAPQADVKATVWRINNHYEFQVTVTNLTNTLLYDDYNDASVAVIVYEDITKNAAKGITTRIDRAVVYQGISSPLESNATEKFSLATPELSGVNWAKLHAVAFVEYRPGGDVGPYTMLQAAVATGASFAVRPNNFSFEVTQANPPDPQGTLQFTGSPSTLAWTVTSKPYWISVTPSSGKVGDSALMKVRMSTLLPGVKNGKIVFTATAPGITRTQTVAVQINYNPPPYLSPQPDSLDFMIDPDHPVNPQVKVKIDGWPLDYQWRVAAKPTWVTVTPNKGIVGDSPSVVINASLLRPGENKGAIRFSDEATGSTVNSFVDVRVVYDDLSFFYVPLIRR